MQLSESAEPEGPHHTNVSFESHASPMRLLLQKGLHQEHPRIVGRRHGCCFHLHQTLMSTPWTLRLVLLAVAAVLLVALGTAAAQAQQLGQEAHIEQQMRPPAETETKLQRDHGAQAHATFSEDGLPRLPRSPVSPPTVTSLQPHRRGISKAMHDSSLSVGRQSEGPSHPSLMRKAPPRRLATNLLPYTDAEARPHTLVHLPKEEDGEHLLAEAASLRGGPQHLNFYGGHPPQYETGSERYYLSQNDYKESDDDLEEQQDHENIKRMNLKISRDAEDERRSRPRRVENSFPVQAEDRNLARHGRFDELLGSRNEASHVPQRHDTFGHAIAEEHWTGNRRAGSGVHPAARGMPNRSRDPPLPDDNIIWSRPSSHGFRWPRTHHASSAQSTQTGSGNTAVEETHKGSGTILIHPASKMTNRGSVTRSEAPFNRETVVIQESGDRRVSHPGMFRPRGGSAPRESVVAKTVSLNDVMEQMNQSYEELIQNLEVKGLSLTYLLRMLNNGDSLDEVRKILEFSKSSDATGSTTIHPISQTINPVVWGQWLNQEIEEQHREMGTVNSHHVEIDRRGEGNPYYSDHPIYAKGVHPISEEVETFQEIYTDVTGDKSPQMPYQPSNDSYDDYFPEDEDDILKTNGQAHIHSLTIKEIPSDITFDANDAHPHYNPRDQLPKKLTSDHFGAANDKLTSSVETDVQNKSILDEQTSWGLQRSGPLTYTVIAASAIMGSIAVFTMFVLVAYSIVKCTKKPMLNNYQVSDKKPVEITA